ncbi:MAG: hypothetical protein HQ592_02915 [Planctomycetes bacterium]|nr:hypothetical protein [Planctomycetota bacterium]
MTEPDASLERIEADLGITEDHSLEQCIDKFYDHLTKGLQLPCDVTGIEDFMWEEVYVIGSGDPDEYERLRRTHPSFQDVYELLAIERDVVSEWMMFRSEDFAARVRRKSDGKEFWLGLAELKAVDKSSANYRLLDDYAEWLMNSR